MDKLEVWFDRINRYPKLKLHEAQKLYREMVAEPDEEKRYILRENIINSTLYVVLEFLKNSNLHILENSRYDMNDIISVTMEFYINQFDKGRLLNIKSFSCASEVVCALK